MTGEGLGATLIALLLAIGCGGRSVGDQSEQRGPSEAPTPSSPSVPSPPPTVPPSPADDPPVPTPVAGPSNDVSGCVGAANVLVLDGDAADFIHPGYERLDAAKWQSDPAMHQSALSFYVESLAGQKPFWWNARMTSGQQTKALAVGTYAGASRAPFAPPGTPGLEISGDGRGCNMLGGTFWIHAIDWSGDFLKHVLLAFEQHCEKGSAVLRGCINYTAPGAYPDADAGP